MIIIEVISVNGKPPEDPLTAEVDELGGNIGRAEGNTLVLPDPDKMISRRHASIAFRGGRYVICDHGTAMPVYVNGRALGNGHESPIDAGDEIRIGGFTLVVKPGARAARPSAVEIPAPRPGPAPRGESKDDPLQILGGPSGRSAGVFDDLIAPTPKARPAAAMPFDAPSADKRAADAKPGAGMAIPPDYDPFETPAAPAAGGPVIPDDFDLMRSTLSGRRTSGRVRPKVAGTATSVEMRISARAPMRSQRPSRPARSTARPFRSPP